MDINLLSWHATGIMTGIPYLTTARKALNITICGLSEHWLLSHNAAVLDSMDQNYNCYTVSCSSPSVFNGRTLSKGGVALLWHKSIDQYVQTLHIDSDRLVAMKLCLPRLSIVVIQVYMPSANNSIQTFKDVIDKRSDTIAIYKEESNIIGMGDFNI